MLARRAAYAVAAARGGIGLSLLVAPRAAGRAIAGEVADRPGGVLLARMAGARDLALAAGTLLALRAGMPPARWLGAAVLADATDALAAATGDGLPPAGRWSTVAIGGGAAALGVWMARAVE